MIYIYNIHIYPQVPACVLCMKEPRNELAPPAGGGATRGSFPGEGSASYGSIYVMHLLLLGVVVICCFCSSWFSFPPLLSDMQVGIGIYGYIYAQPPPNDPPQPAICFTMLDLCLHRTTLKSPTSRPCRSSITFAKLRSYAAVKTASTHQSLIGFFLRLRLSY